MGDNRAKPFLKWAGGKFWLARLAEELVPDKYGRYFEPFLGGASMFFALAPRAATLTDSNSDLIEAYQQVAFHSDRVLQIFERYRYSRASFYRARRSRPRTPHGAAARFIFLNRTAWNGLYRVNQNGDFNVPFGSFTSPLDEVPARIKRASSFLRRSRMRISDFGDAINEAGGGDFVYADPPYVSRHKDNGFLRYNARVFSWQDQERLRTGLERLHQRGGLFLLSNADHPSISKMYSGFEQTRVSRRSLVAASPSHRGSVTELLISNYRPRFVRG